MAELLARTRLRTRARSLDPSRRATSARPMLWGAEDLLRWVIAAGLGGIVIAVGWYIAAGEATFGQQVGPLDAALAGLFLSAIGNFGWLLRGRRALGERRKLLLPDVVGTAASAVAPAVMVNAVPSPSTAASANEVFLAGEGMERYHRPDCALAVGRTGWTTAMRREHEAAGRRPCGVCRP